jgi:expansin (peptidoglycan-binding protein)
MGRLQGGGSLNQGVIPTQYRRVPCPTLGNVYVWMHDGGGPYYFMASAVNSYGSGSLVNFEIQGSGQSAWSALERDPDYTTSRPQERYGAWVIPQNTGPYNVPLSVRLTSSTGEQIVAMNVITSFTAPASAPSGFWYLDMGVQFTR